MTEKESQTVAVLRVWEREGFITTADSAVAERMAHVALAAVADAVLSRLRQLSTDLEHRYGAQDEWAGVQDAIDVIEREFGGRSA